MVVLRNAKNDWVIESHNFAFSNPSISIWRHLIKIRFCGLIFKTFHSSCLKRFFCWKLAHLLTRALEVSKRTHPCLSHIAGFQDSCTSFRGDPGNIFWRQCSFVRVEVSLLGFSWVSLISIVTLLGFIIAQD